MAGDPLSYKGSGLPHRTPRSQARAHGTKVPEKPQISGYCGLHGMVHNGACPTNKVDADAEEISRAGGGAKLPTMKPPFKLGG